MYYLYIYGIYVSSFINIYILYIYCMYVLHILYILYTYKHGLDVYSYGAQHGERPNNAN